MNQLKHLKIFADSASLHDLQFMNRVSPINGITTNPTLMRQCNIRNYRSFVRDLVTAFPDLPISLSTIADTEEEMERQANILAEWGPKVYVKIPAMTTQGKPTTKLIRRLVDAEIRVNVTALMTSRAVQEAIEAVDDRSPAFISILAGRIADTGVDPEPIVQQAVMWASPSTMMEIIWASPREVWNLVQAKRSGCHIVTLPRDLHTKCNRLGKDLEQYSRETIQMFLEDGLSAGYVL